LGTNSSTICFATAAVSGLSCGLRIIGSKVEGLIIQFDTCQTLLQDIVENGFKFKSGEATECKIDPELLYDRLWTISNLMFDTILQYNLMMGEDDDGAVQIHLDGADTAREHKTCHTSSSTILQTPCGVAHPEKTRGRIERADWQMPLLGL